jgi:hypothetical protein
MASLTPTSPATIPKYSWQSNSRDEDRKIEDKSVINVTKFRAPHHYYTTTTPVPHLYYTCTTPVLHLYHTCTTPVQYLY